MKKILNFFGVLLILFFVFACTLPSEIEVSGSPSLKFAVNMDFGDCFTDMLETFMNDDGKTKIVPCTNSSLPCLTYILRLEIIKDDFRLNDTGGTITINNTPVGLDSYSKVSSPVDIAVSNEPYTLSFNGLEDYLDGFEFTGIKSKIYIYGPTDLAKVLSIELTNEYGSSLLSKDINDNVSSGIENIKEFTGPELPSGGANIDIKNIINKGEDLTLNYRIYIKAGQEINLDWFDKEHSITAELVIWLPMGFETTKPNAEFKFPDFFNDIGDTIKSLSGSGYINNMKFTIAIDPSNPFGNGLFIISDVGYGDIQKTLDDHNFYIKFTKEEIDYINNNPFNPRFFIKYPTTGSLLVIPKGNIMITTVSFNADFIYNVEF